jgi:hypothetical protein
MVRDRIIYTCEICGEEWESRSGAEGCERKGVPGLLPIGTIFARKDYKEKIVFAVIKQQEKRYGHHHSYSCWACRDMPELDGTGKTRDNCKGEDYCGLDSWNFVAPPNRKLPAYKRMVRALRKVKITPMDYKVKK